jgi:DNA-directed RNA polymerase subunit H (RpoH/RPB5)
MEITSLEYILIQSRSTILDLLEKRGYDSARFRKLIGPELVKLVSNPESLRMTLISKKNPEKKAIVEYAIKNSIKVSVTSGDYIEKLLSDTPSKTHPHTLYNVNSENTEVIVLFHGKETSDDKETPYDKCALDAWMNRKFKIQFFPITRLVANPLEHMLQPKFEIVAPEDHERIMKEWFIKSITQFPIIKFHADIAGRCLGLLPLDLVKITSPSPTAGEYVKYRVCAP